MEIEHTHTVSREKSRRIEQTDMHTHRVSQTRGARSREMRTEEQKSRTG